MDCSADSNNLMNKILGCNMALIMVKFSEPKDMERKVKTVNSVSVSSEVIDRLIESDRTELS